MTHIDRPRLMRRIAPALLAGGIFIALATSAAVAAQEQKSVATLDKLVVETVMRHSPCIRRY
jgi:hypothetical protein